MNKYLFRTVPVLIILSLILTFCSCSTVVTVSFTNSMGISFINPTSVSENAPAPKAADSTPSAVQPAENQPATTPAAPEVISSEPDTLSQPVNEDSEAPEKTDIPPEAAGDPNDPSTWSVQQIVDCYKNGMQKTDDSYDCYTGQQMQLVGNLPGKAAAITKPVNLAMKLGSQPFNALTGGYWDLCPDDLTYASARKDGKYVVINLVPKEQTDGPGADEHEGHTGHVVNVVQGIDGFLGYVEENFGALNAHYTEEGVQIHYRDAFAKDVYINTETGEMEKGSWGYTIDLHIDDASILRVSLDDFNACIKYDCWYPPES